MIYKQGTPLVTSGYRGTIVRHYEGNMYEVRLPGGIGCIEVHNNDIILDDAFWTRNPDAYKPKN